MTEHDESAPNPSRRSLLFKAGVAFNVLAGTLLAIPVVGYVF